DGVIAVMVVHAGHRTAGSAGRQGSGRHFRCGYHDQMKLWTYQGEGFDPRSDRVDWTRSDFWNDPAIRKVYPVLWRRLGVEDGQILWCCTRQERGNWEGKVEWVLDVSPLDCWFTDGLVWNRLLDRQCSLPQKMRYAIMDEALLHHPDDPEQRAAYERRKEAE